MSASELIVEAFKQIDPETVRATPFSITVTNEGKYTLTAKQANWGCAETHEGDISKGIFEPPLTEYGFSSQLERQLLDIANAVLIHPIWKNERYILSLNDDAIMVFGSIAFKYVRAFPSNTEV